MSNLSALKFAIAQQRPIHPLAKEFIERVNTEGGILYATDKQISKAVRAVIPSNPSLFLPTVASKEGKLFSPIPADGTGDFTVARNSPAYTENADGSISEVAANMPCYVYKDGRPATLRRSAMTNLFRDSEPATNPGQGSIMEITFSENDWGIGDFAGKVVFGDNSVARRYLNAVDLTASETYTIAFIIKCANTPTFRHEDAAGFSLCAVSIGGAITGHTTLKNELISGFDDLYFCVITGTSGSAIHQCGLRKETAYNATPFEVSAIMVVAGDVDLQLTDYIKTTGTTETRDPDLISVDLPTGVTTVTLTDIDDVETVDASPADPYVIPVGSWKKIIMED